MKRWQMELMGALLLTLTLVLFMGVMGVGVVLFAPILWFLGRRAIDSTAGEPAWQVRVLQSLARFTVTTFAAFGVLILVEGMNAFPRISVLAGTGDAYALLLLSLFCLLVYWLERAYALAPFDGARQLVLRALITMILGNLTLIGFGYTLVALYFWLAQPGDGPIRFGWMAWIVGALGFILPFYATWKLLPQKATTKIKL
jgi:hypothetical protein